MGLDYVVLRCEKAGVFAGYLESQVGNEVVLKDVRRLWYWSGADSITQIALEGVKKPDDCKFTPPLMKKKLIGVFEIDYATEEARKNIQAVKEWRYE